MNATATESRHSDRIAFLRLRGTLDDKTVFSFKKTVFNVPATKKVLVLDLSRLDHASNVGLGTMIDAFRYFRKRGGRVFLVQPSEEMQLLLRHFRASELCSIVTTYEEVQDQLQMQSSLDLSDNPFVDADPSEYMEEVEPRRGRSKGQAVHHHYYGGGNAAAREKVRSRDSDEAFEQPDALHALNQTLSRLEQTLGARQESASTERLFTRLEEIGMGEGRIQERLGTLERNLSMVVDDRIDRLEAKLFDRLGQTTPLSVKAAATAFAGFRMVECAHCRSVLRVKQSGRHLCPACEKEFSVDEQGRPHF